MRNRGEQPLCGRRTVVAFGSVAKSVDPGALEKMHALNPQNQNGEHLEMRLETLQSQPAPFGRPRVPIIVHGVRVGLAIGVSKLGT